MSLPRLSAWGAPGASEYVEERANEENPFMPTRLCRETAIPVKLIATGIGVKSCGTAHSRWQGSQQQVLGVYPAGAL